MVSDLFSVALIEGSVSKATRSGSGACVPESFDALEPPPQAVRVPKLIAIT